ncbi:MAG: hypothetical protein RLZZ393_680 [Pseudomonadota bacterium]|jgi:hypothetical protein
MALLEAVLLMATQATAPAPPAKAGPPPLELLEFLAEWPDEDGTLIDQEKDADKDGAGRQRRGRDDRDARGKAP